MNYATFFSALSETLAAIAIGGGYISLFAVIILEGIPIFGILIPGHVIIVGAGFLASTGIFDPLAVLAIGISGAIIGDCGSYLLGRYMGWPFIDRLRRLFFVKDTHIERAKAILAAHTGKALIAGRFNPVTRGIMPFLVGANHLPVRPFLLFNALGAALWVSASVALGYALGLGFDVAEGSVGRLALAAVIGGILIVWGYRFVNIRYHVFRRYELFALIANVMALLILARMVQDVSATEPFLAMTDVRIDLFFRELVQGEWGAAITGAASAASAVLGVTAISVYGSFAAVWFAAKRMWRRCAITILALVSSAISVAWLKEIFGRVRPDGVEATYQWLASDPSFPSGHAVFAGAFFFLLAYHLAPRVQSLFRRELMVAACALLAVLVAVSRLVLSVHWATDVTAGLALGVFCATGSILFVRYIAAILVSRVND